MITFREISNLILAELRDNATLLKVKADDILPGKYGQDPSKSSSILVFLEPTAKSKSANGIAKVTIFCCEANESHIEAVTKSFSLAQRVFHVISKVKDVSSYADVEFVTFFNSNLAISSVTTEVKFKYDALEIV